MKYVQDTRRFFSSEHIRVLHVSPSDPTLGCSTRYFQINNSRGIMLHPAQLSGGGGRSPGAGAPPLPTGFAALLTDSPSYLPCCAGECCLLSVPIPTLSLSLACVFSASVTPRKASERGAAFCCGTPFLACLPSAHGTGKYCPTSPGAERGAVCSRNAEGMHRVHLQSLLAAGPLFLLGGAEGALC